eukprot:3359909-Prymnesium_polylepis.1
MGCCYESGVPPAPPPPTPLCDCTPRLPCKWLLGRWWCPHAPARHCCGFESRSERPPPVSIDPKALAAQHARETAALVTASAFGVDAFCYVAPSDCGLGLFARSALRRGQAVIEY